MANIRSDVYVPQPHRVTFAYNVVFGDRMPYTLTVGEARQLIIKKVGPLSWNELAKSADFYRNHPQPIRANAIKTLRASLPYEVIL